MSTPPIEPEEDPRARIEWLRQRSLGDPSLQVDAGAVLDAALEVRRSSAIESVKWAEMDSETEWARSQQTWSYLGPVNVGGRIRALAIHPDGRPLYAGSATGGVWRSDDEGESWRPLMSEEDSLTIGALAIDPENPEILYAGTGEPYVRLIYPGVGVLRSTEGGKPGSWCRIGPPGLSRISRLLVDPDNTEIVYCAGYEGLFRSRDRGEDWRPLSFGNITDVKINADGRLLIGVYGQGLFISDGADGWSPLGQDVLPRPRYRPLAALGRCPYCHSEMIHARIDNEVYSSCNGGSHWLPVDVGTSCIKDTDWARLIVVHPLRPHVVFVGGMNLYYFQAGCGKYPSTPIEFVKLEAGSAEDSEIPLDQPVDQHDLAFHPSNADIVYVANDSGVFRSDDGGRRGAKKSHGLNVTQFYDFDVSRHDPYLLGGGTQDRGTLILKGREDSIRVLPNDGGHLAFDPAYKDAAWGQIQEHSIHKIDLTDYTHKGWTGKLDQDERLFSGIVVAVEVHEKRRRAEEAKNIRSTVLLTGRQHVFRDLVSWKTETTLTGGSVTTLVDTKAEWELVSPRLGGDVTAIAIDPGNRSLIVGTSTGQVWRSLRRASEVNAEEWLRLTPLVDDEEEEVPRVPDDWPQYRNVSRIVFDEARSSPDEESYFYVCFGGVGALKGSRGDHVWIKEDRSAKFERRTGHQEPELEILPNIATHGMVIDRRSPDFLYVCNDVGVFRSVDRGEHWHPFSSGLPNVPCFDIHLHQDPEDPTRRPGLLRVATHGRGIYELKV